MASGKANGNSILFLESIFQATFANIGNLLANAASPKTNLYVSLYNSTGPGAGGAATNNETGYTNYVRVAVARTSSGWSISSETISNVAAVNFATCGVTGDTLTYVGICSDTPGNSGVLLWYGALTSNLIVSSGITPAFAIGALTITES